MYTSQLVEILNNKAPICESKLNWDDIINEARANKLLEYLAWLAKNKLTPVVPTQILEDLSTIYFNSHLTNLLMKAELKRILVVLASHNIAGIVLKGLPFAERIYGGLGTRNSGDIDLLVQESDLEVAFRVLEQQGYKHCVDITPQQIEKFKFNQHLVFTKTHPSGTFIVEVHFMFTDHYGQYIVTSDLWSRATQINIDNAIAYELSPADLLMHICLHSVEHGFDVLRSVFDVAKVIEVEGHLIDWDFFVETAIRYKLKNRMYFSLLYAQLIFNSEIPAYVLELLKPPTYLLRRFERSIQANHRSTALPMLTWVMIRNENLRGVLQEFRVAIFAPYEKLRIMYALDDSKVFYRYYLTYWWETIRKFIK